MFRLLKSSTNKSDIVCSGYKQLLNDNKVDKCGINCQPLLWIDEDDGTRYFCKPSHLWWYLNMPTKEKPVTTQEKV